VNILCSAVSVALPTVGGNAVNGPLASHVESCAHCRGEVAAYGEIHTSLEAMRQRRVSAPPALPHRVMASLGPVAVPELKERHDRRVPVAAAAALATAAAGTAVLVSLYRHRAA